MLSDDDIIERGGTQEDINRYAHDVGGACSAEFGNCDMCQPPAKSEDELYSIQQFHPTPCDKYEVLRGMPPNHRRKTGASCSCGFDIAIKQEAEAHADAVIGEYERTLKARPPFVRNALRAEQRKRNVYPIKDPK